MFTGLIEGVGRVQKLQRSGAAAELTVAAELAGEEVAPGDSVAVNGVCLTATRIQRGLLTFDVSPESLARTALARLTGGDPVNLERALRLSDRIGGHLVTGHIDCTATIARRSEESGNIVFSFSLPVDACRYVIEKGSVAVDGISLTVNRVVADGFSVNVIPHTAQMTTLRFRKPGDLVNIETDIIGRYVERLLSGGQPARNPAGVSLQTLMANGFA